MKPTLETARLRLVPLGPEHVEPMIAMQSDPETMRFLGDGTPQTRAIAWRAVAAMIGHWEIRGFGLWAVEDKASGAFLGRMGLWEPEGWECPEISYALATVARGHGYASEGARAVLAQGNRQLAARLHTQKMGLASFIRRDNIASIRVATALGACFEKTIELFGSTADLYRYPLPQPDITRDA